tara:strand:+ start:127 stop:756 length:630 start_codon:yes stop_codon:yes gene_type:complete
MRSNNIWKIALSTTCALAAIGFSGATIADAFGEPAFDPISSAAEFRTGGFQAAERIQTPAPRPTAPAVTVPPVTVPAGPSAEIRAILDLTNAQRASGGLAPVSLHPQLTQAGEGHFNDQFRHGCENLTHSSTDGSSPFDRIKGAGFVYRTAGENLACGYLTPEKVMAGWMNSPGHADNIMNGDFAHIGIVAAPDAFGHMYWVQVFGTTF